ncbi:MAG: hypothetical protein WB869_14560 [Candidatus Acidiferrales bacterium]
MRRLATIPGAMALAYIAGAALVCAAPVASGATFPQLAASPVQQSSPAAAHDPAKSSKPAEVDATVVDGIVERIEDDIITESEVRELEAFQKLVNGRAMSRDDVIRELTDQWIIRNEAGVNRFRQPSAEAQVHAFEDFSQRFSSPEEMHARLAEAGLTEAALKRLLGEQLYLSSFLEVKFRPVAQVTEDQIDAYYGGEFTDDLKKRGESIPPRADVEDQIRELLTERTVSERSERWLDDTRTRLHIELLPFAGGQ